MRRIEADILIVGSGAAGGVMAATLSQLLPNLRIVLTEKGAHYGSEFFNEREWDMRVLYADKGRRTTADGAVAVRSGECVGGGTTVNVALCLDPLPGVWARWRAESALEGFSFAPEAADYGLHGLNMARCLEEVKKRSEVHVARDEELNDNNRIFEQACRQYGIVARRFSLNHRNCVGSGFCTEGCAYDAKLGTALTYIPDAIARDVQLIHHFGVERLEFGDSHRVTGAIGRVRPTTAGSSPNSVEPGPLRVTAKLVIVAAGAVGTPVLLQRSQVPDPHERVGRGLVLHPSLAVMSLRDQKLTNHTGIPGTVYSEEYYPSHGFYLECLFGKPVYGAVVLPGLADEHFSLLGQLNRISAFGIMLVDSVDDRNRVELLHSGVRIHYQLSENDKVRLRFAARKAVELSFSGGARKVILASDEELPGLGRPRFDRREQASACDSLKFIPHRTTLTSAHCQATTKMSEDPRQGVANSRGEIHGARNLIVCDASSFPSSCGANPMISIMTMARYQATRIAGEWLRYV